MAISLVPRQISLPNRLLLVLLFARAEVDRGGMYFGALPIPGNRTPTLSIQGPTNLTVDVQAASVQGAYQGLVTDSLGNVSFQWGGQGQVVSQGGSATSIRFNRGNAAAGAVLQRTVTLAASDDDGPIDPTQLTVNIHVVDQQADDDRPLVCRVKPWMEICRGGG